MGEIASIDSPVRLTARDAFESAKQIVIAGGEVEEIANTLMISERRARELYVKANASITVDDYSWTNEQVAAFSRAAKVRIAAEGMVSDDPKHRKVALDALKALDEATVGAVPDADRPSAPPMLKADLRSIIDPSYTKEKVR